MMRIVYSLYVYYLSVSAERVFDTAKDCFNVVDSCPQTRQTWEERSSEYDCTSPQIYTCLMNKNMTVVETCVYEMMISGCPFLALCEDDYGPVVASDFIECDAGVQNCPSTNHTGYLSEMFKYPGCFKIHVKKSVTESPKLAKATYTTGQGFPSEYVDTTFISLVPSLTGIGIIALLALVIFCIGMLWNRYNVKLPHWDSYASGTLMDKHDFIGTVTAFNDVDLIAEEDTTASTNLHYGTNDKLRRPSINRHSSKGPFNMDLHPQDKGIHNFSDDQVSLVPMLRPVSFQHDDAKQSHGDSFTNETPMHQQDMRGTATTFSDIHIIAEECARQTASTNFMSGTNDDVGRLPIIGHYSKATFSMDLLPLDNSDDINKSTDDQVSLAPTRYVASFQHVKLPPEIMQCLKENNYKLGFWSLNATTMKLLSNAPKAIQLVGRIGFIAKLTSFEIGTDTKEGKDLQLSSSMMTENSHRCFEVANEHFEDIKYTMNNVIDRLRRLSSIMSSKMQGTSCEIPCNSEFINSISEEIDHCTKLCEKTVGIFKDFRKDIDKCDGSFRNVVDKIDKRRSNSVETKGTQLEKYVFACVKKIKESIEQTDALFRQLSIHWVNFTAFFREMHLFLEKLMKKDIDLYARLSTMDVVQVDVHAKNGMVDQLQTKARYGRLVSEFYIYVFRNILTECLEIISRLSNINDQMAVVEAKTSMDRLQNCCVDAENMVLYLCGSIDKLINV